jgi:hypothetical protein
MTKRCITEAFGCLSMKTFMVTAKTGIVLMNEYYPMKDEKNTRAVDISDISAIPRGLLLSLLWCFHAPSFTS